MSRPDILEAGERLESLSEKLARTGVIVDGPWEWFENTGYVFGPISHKSQVLISGEGFYPRTQAEIP